MKPAEERPGGQSFGPWTVIGELGRGGMGRVLLVERQSPHQQAALKILSAAIHGEEERQRFRREQEILARLEHPSIARFLDAGETPRGEPYLVLEKVDGQPIDRYCAGARPLLARLAVFLDLCRAVAAAHHQLIVHCDLKPSNVLVREDGKVKLLDFGLARPADQRLGTASLASGFSTLSYASPEQLAGRRLTSASDLYSLGVLLFEILTGRKPFGDGEAGFLEQVESRNRAPRASALLPPGSPGALRRALRQDLDYVIAKALRVEPENRYATVDELIADLEAHLAGRPVAARRGDRRYVAWRFLRRNALGVAAAALLLLILVGSVVTLGLQARRLAAEGAEARRQQMVASQSADFFLGLMESAGGQDQQSDPAIQVLTSRAVVRLDDALDEAPLVRAEVLNRLGYHNRLMANARESERLVRAAMAIWERELGPESPFVVSSLSSISLSRLQAGDLDEACRLADEAARLAAKAGDRFSLMHSATALGFCARESGRLAEADRLFSEAERMVAAEYGLATADHEDALANLIHIKRLLDRPEELESVLRRLLRERLERRPTARDFYTLQRVQMLVELLIQRGALDEAEAELETWLAHMEKLGPTTRFRIRGPHAAEFQLQLADIKRRRGHLQEALRLVREAAGRMQRDLPPDHFFHREARRVLALSLLDSGSPAAALPLLEQLKIELQDPLIAQDFDAGSVEKGLEEARARLQPGGAAAVRPAG